MKSRIEQLTRMLPDTIDALLILKPANRAYISGFTGSSGYLVIGREASFIATDFRYTEQARDQCPGIQVITYDADLYDTLNSHFAIRRIARLGFEVDFVTYASWTDLTNRLEVTLVPQAGLADTLRLTKDPIEKGLIGRAAKIAEESLNRTLAIVKPGMTEFEIAVELEQNMRRLGSYGQSFATIVVSGPRSSLPHGRPTERRIELGDFLTLDFGATHSGYCSDMTRTFVVGKPSFEQKRVYEIVLQAQLRALSAVKPGIMARDLDSVARSFIAESGFDGRFGHCLGHGVGRVVSEGPLIDKGSKDVLSVGNVVTIEPGIYIPDWGGVRIEDMIFITEDGHHNFNKFTKELIEL